jgi:SAM-dependent methyltransferase
VNCRACGGASFGDVLDLGPMPLVNKLPKSADEPCDRWPLKAVFCRSCSLAQLTHTPPPEAMFAEYLYFSSQSQTMVAHATDLVNRYVKKGDRVLEIASNDGYLLKPAQELGARVLGVDPARNIAQFANEQGIPTRCEFFNAQSAREIARQWGRADVIFANNVLAHVPDPNEIAAGIGEALAEDGVAHIEVPWLVRMIDSCAFDTIYHEHQCYFSLTALKALFNRHGLKITGTQLVTIHGGSLHLQVCHGGSETAASAFVEEEARLGVSTDAYYAAFADRVESLGRHLKQIISRFDWVGGYGAAAKGVVLLNRFGLDAQQIRWVADVSPHKIGRFIPGTRQLIVEPKRLLDERPPAVLLLPWNIQEEICRRNQEYLDQGGRFIVPIPEVHVI